MLQALPQHADIRAARTQQRVNEINQQYSNGRREQAGTTMLRPVYFDADDDVCAPAR